MTTDVLTLVTCPTTRIHSAVAPLLMTAAPSTSYQRVDNVISSSKIYGLLVGVI